MRALLKVSGERDWNSLHRSVVQPMPCEGRKHGGPMRLDAEVGRGIDWIDRTRTLPPIFICP